MCPLINFQDAREPTTGGTTGSNTTNPRGGRPIDLHDMGGCQGRRTQIGTAAEGRT